MSDNSGPTTVRQERPPARLIARGVLRAVASTAVLVTAYYLLPLNRSSSAAAVAILITGLILLIGLVVGQVRSIMGARFPGLRAIEALAISVPLFLLLFASAYVVMDAISAGSFSEHLTRTSALYFAVTVFGTVGFGDITAKTTPAELVVTGQMIIDLIIFGLGARVIVGAISRGRRRQGADGRDSP